MIRRPPRSTLSLHDALPISVVAALRKHLPRRIQQGPTCRGPALRLTPPAFPIFVYIHIVCMLPEGDRKSTRLNSSHANISYAVFCLKKKTAHSDPRAQRGRG